jgi:ribonuclease P protein component
LRRGFDEKDLSAQQLKTQADAWFLGKDEYKRRSKCVKAEATEGEEEAGRLSFPEFVGPQGHPFDRSYVERSFRFRQKERITKSQEFRRVMKSGRRMTSRNFVVFMHKNENKTLHRLGIVAKKEIGPAAFRNRVRRYIREFFRLHKHQIDGSYDIIFLIRKGCVFRRYQEAEEELKRLFL